MGEWGATQYSETERLRAAVVVLHCCIAEYSNADGDMGLEAKEIGQMNTNILHAVKTFNGQLSQAFKALSLLPLLRA